MSEVVKFYPKDAALNADNVLEQASGAYKSVLLLGLNADGDMEVRSTIDLDEADLIWLLERFKHNLLSGAYEP